MKKKTKLLLILSCIIIASSVSIIWGIFTFFRTPSARSAYGMVLDENLNKIILFGGGAQDSGSYSYFGDTWIYDPNTNLWSEIFTLTHPSSRSSHSMVYDPVHQKIIFFGGIDSDERWMNDTWIFNSQINRWTQVFPAKAPSPRGSASMYYDYIAQSIILFGGYQESGGPLDDTWLYNSETNNWTKLDPIVKPTGRYGAPMIYDPINSRGFMFGGRTSTITDDTWVYYFSNNTWSQLNITICPSNRYWEGLTYDEHAQKIILFGGRGSGGVGDGLDDTWTYDPTHNTWTESFPSSHPTHRFHFSLVYSSKKREIILFGGFRFTDTNFGDTWSFDHSTNNWELRIE